LITTLIIYCRHKLHCPERSSVLWLSLLSTANFTARSEMSSENGTGNFDSWHLHLRFTTVTHPSSNCHKLCLLYSTLLCQEIFKLCNFLRQRSEQEYRLNFLCRLFLLTSGISLNTKKKSVFLLYTYNHETTPISIYPYVGRGFCYFSLEHK
jgi:hypothetical protein